ncbi:TVP38/TMEM64 family protein [bacterium]|nr:MAG: TVP38/TMEM64 family protein [bacterium]
MRHQPTTPAQAPRATLANKRWLILLLLVVALAFAASSDGLHSLLLRFVAVAAELMTERPVLGAGLFVLFAAVSAMVAFFSSAVLVPVAVYMWGNALCLLALWAGWTLGGMASYGIGRSLGRPVVKSLLSASTLSRYEDRISGRTPFGHVLLLQLALPSEVPGYLLGLARYPFWKYLAALMLSELPYAVGTVYLGASFLDRRLPVLLGVGAAGALLMALAFRALQRRLREG